MRTASESNSHSMFITTAKSTPQVAQHKSALSLQTRLRVEQIFELAILPLSIRLDQVASRHQRNERKVEEIHSRLQWLHQDLKESGLLECEKSGALKKMKELSLIRSLVTSTHERRGDKSKDELCKSSKAHLLAENLLHFTECELQEKGEIEQNLIKYFKRETRAVILKRKKLMEDVRSQVIDQKLQIDLVRGLGRKSPKLPKRSKATTEAPMKPLQTKNYQDILHLLEHTSSNEVEDVLQEKENLLEADHPKDSTAICTKPQKIGHARCLEPVSPEDQRPNSLSPGRKLTDDELVQFLIRNYSKPLQERKENLQTATQTTDKPQEPPSCFRMSSEERRCLVNRMLGGERLHHQMTPEKHRSNSDRSQSPREPKRNFAFGKLSKTDLKDPLPQKRSLTPEERREIISSYLRKELCLNHMKVTAPPKSPHKTEAARNFAFGKLSRSESKFSSKVRSLSPEERKELMEKYLKKETELAHMKVSDEQLSQAKDRRTSREPQPKSFHFGIHNIFPESNKDCMPKSLTRSDRKEAIRKNLRDHELFHHQLPPKPKIEQQRKQTSNRTKKPPSPDRLAQLAKPRTPEKPKLQFEAKKPAPAPKKHHPPVKLIKQERSQITSTPVSPVKSKPKELTSKPPSATSQKQSKLTKPQSSQSKKTTVQHKAISMHTRPPSTSTADDASKQQPAEEPVDSKPQQPTPIEDLLPPEEDEMWMPSEEEPPAAPPVVDEELLPADDEDFHFSEDADPDEPDPNADAISLKDASESEQQQGEVRVTSD